SLEARGRCRAGSEDLLCDRRAMEPRVFVMRALILVALFLAACGHQPVVQTVEGGGCKIIEQHDKQICGRGRDDQEGLDLNMVCGTAACNWEPRKYEPCNPPKPKPKLFAPRPKPVS